MTIAEQYARALFDAVAREPNRGEAYLANLRAALERRGHQKLLPSVLRQYEKLALKHERSRRQARVTPETRRTRMLLELYEKLITS